MERYATNLGQSKSYAYDLFGGRFSTNPYSAYKRETAIYILYIYIYIYPSSEIVVYWLVDSSRAAYPASLTGQPGNNFYPGITRTGLSGQHGS